MIFDQNAMTAASPSIPLGSRIKVTLHDTGRSVVVLVNDRQSPHSGRILDLSRGAARRIGMIDMGHGVVTVAPADDTIEVAEAPEGDVEWVRRQPRATWSATYAPRRPIGFGGPPVESLTVCSSSSAFNSAPRSTTYTVT